MAYNRDETIAIHSESFGEKYRETLYLDDEDEAQQRELLDTLKNEFGLRPWTDIDGRLRELERQYLPKLQVFSFEEWCERNGVGEIKL